MSEELYLRYEMKYWDSMKKEVAAEVKMRLAETARSQLAKGVDVDIVSETFDIPRDEVLAMKAELDGKLT